uniref:Sodium channel protein n=1 Tax=Haptolina brevifila TaxID=156173 RepID=A0A7S2IXR0_9EUKA
MDATGKNKAPERNDSSAASIFFLAWMIVGCFIALNLFVGAIVDNFTRIKQESDGSATMTPEQLQWVAALRETVNNKPMHAPREPKWPPRKAAYRLINTREFEMIVIGVIIGNVLGMALDFHRIDEYETYYYFYSNGMLFFTYFYYAEFLVKFFGLGPIGYFSDPWCRFDFFLVCVSLGDQFFSELLETLLPFPPTMIRVLRVARVLRILRLLKNLKGLRDLVMTLVFAFPALINVSCLLGLVIFMYAVLGLNLFTFVMPGEALADGRDFVTFSNACLTLFQCLTGDGWSELMDDAMVNEERGCDPSAGDCGTPLALPYFISFIVIGTFVFLNLVVAVILENFTSLGNVNPDLVSTNDITEFKEAWGRYDPDADGMIPAKVLPELVLGLPPPLGIQGTKEGTSPSKAYRFCLSLGLTQVQGEVGFKNVLDALINKNYKARKVEVAAGNEGGPPPAVRDMLEKRQKTLSGSIDLSKVTPAGLDEPLTERRFEMSRILAEELLRMFIRRKRETWSQNPQEHPSYRKREEEKAKAEAAAAEAAKAAAAAAAVPAKGAKGAGQGAKGGAKQPAGKPAPKQPPKGKDGGKGGGKGGRYDA